MRPRNFSSQLLLLLCPNLAGLLLPAASTSAARSDCPGGCVCKWKDGKETTECADLALGAVPAGVAPGTQVLDLRRNEGIAALPSGVFVELGITNLQKIFLQDCSVSEIGPGAFDRLTNLVELDLSGNSLREVPSESWSDKMALMRLRMARNPIKLIRRGAFSQLKFVMHLDLSSCHIENIEIGAFQGMESLRELKLQDNRLNYLHGESLFPPELNHIEERHPPSCPSRPPSQPSKSDDVPHFSLRVPRERN